MISQRQAILTLKSLLWLLIGINLLSAPIVVAALISDMFSINPSLFIPAMIGIAGSFGLYIYKQYRVRNRIRASLRSEIGQMSEIDKLPKELNKLDTGPPDQDIPPSVLPPFGSISTVAYESNLSQMSLLPEDEFNMIVDFYGLVLTHKPHIKEIQTGNDLPMSLQEDLCEDAESLRDKRQELYERL
ncbi:hypothetical protein [Haloferax denitrificans]|uniref:hypothetical protein n=1 Tax=Haloferax denitrificans TaxID=35745 RepID=UPI003C6F6F7F